MKAVVFITPSRLETQLIHRQCIFYASEMEDKFNGRVCFCWKESLILQILAVCEHMQYT
jgi:hypothetical protein